MVKTIRAIFLVLSAVVGYNAGLLLSEADPIAGVAGGVILAFGVFLLMILEGRLKKVSFRNILVILFGLAAGLFMTWLISLVLELLPLGYSASIALRAFITLVLCYLAIVAAVRSKDEISLIIPYVRFSGRKQKSRVYVLDASVIMDGRIDTVTRTGFLPGKMVIPRFVLNELHQIADSSDETKRTRGQKGLDMLEKLKSSQSVEVVVHEEMLAGIRETETKLIRLARILEADILTDDANLSKVSKIEDVKVLNINDLANALRPVVYPGEAMHVYIRKEGKEKNQGVAFLEDGTMVVVDNAKHLMGKKVAINVTSTLQTSAGKMIFGTLADNGK